MSPARKALWALATLAAVVATLKAGQGILNSPALGNRQLVEFAGRAPCAAAKRLARDAGEFDCSPGERVPALFQVVIPLQDDGGVNVEAALDVADSIDLIRASMRFPPMARAVRPGKAVTLLDPFDPDCIVGEWATDAGEAWSGDWHAAYCCRPGCYCAGRCRPALTTYVAGDEDATVRRLLCRAVPEHPSCDAGAP